MSYTQPVRELYVTNAAEKLYVRTTGNPAADNVLILVHGGPGLSHRYLSGLEQLASDQLLVVSYDQRGCGRSVSITQEQGQVKELPGKIPDNLDLLSYAQDLEAVRRAIAGEKKVHLLAHSWGGMVIMSYAAQYSEQTRSLLLIDCIPPTWSGQQRAIARLHARVQALQKQGIIPTELSTDPKERLAQIFLAYTPVLNFSSLEMEMTPAINGKTWETIKGYDIRDQLSPLQLPILIFFGENDPFGTECAEETKPVFANANVTTKFVPNCGHMGWLEYPDIFYPTVREFLAQNS
ncbi:MAG TPA: alpha/beta fold hydrolase [Dictyobacter sp.]|nr:alpha/beta fold hydrolase [Dictyobacter sp.]